MTRVLMVSLWFYPSRGGSQWQAWQLARQLARRGVPVSAVTVRRPGLARVEAVEGVSIHRIWALGGGGLEKAGSWASYANAFAFTLSLFIFLVAHRREYDVLHVHQALFPAVSAMLAARLLGKKCIVKFSGTGVSGNVAQLSRRWFNRMFLPVIARADAFVVLTGEGRAELRSVKFDDTRTLEIPNGVDTETFQPPTGRPRVKTIVNVARFTYEKGQGVLLRALAQCQSPDARLVLAGDGPERARMERLADELGLKQQVCFPGVVTDVVGLLKEAAIFVLPSIGEGMSNALLEAMAVGVPCIASDIPSNRAVIHDGTNGLLFRSGDSNDLARCLDRLFGDEEWARQLGAAARRTVEADFVIERVVDRYMALYDRLVHRPGS